MGNQLENNEKNDCKYINIEGKSFKDRKDDFQSFREMILRYEYYSKLLQLSFKNNKILKILYKPESSFGDYYMKMFYILEKIPYINYQKCIKLSQKSHSQNKDDEKNKINNDSKKDLINLNKVKFDLSNNNKLNIKKRNTIVDFSSSKNVNKPNIKKKKSFDISIPEQNPNGLFRYNNGEKGLYYELIYIMEKICLYDIKKIQKILMLYPINNLRWIIWLSVARSKYNKTQNKINISNSDIYKELVRKVELKDDSLMFELHNTLKELNVFKCNWSSSLYKIIKCLLLYKKNTKYETGMNILIGVPLLISDCNEEDTFFFARFLFSSYYGLGLFFFFGEDELLLNYLVFIIKYLTKEKFPKVYDLFLMLNIADDLWIKKWIRTFFSSIFDLSITIRVWDCVIAVGLKFLVNYCLAIFEYFRDKILSLKKVKYFLEFFDYDLKKRYTKKKDIIHFREEIIRLAQSYSIPDGKYQLIEKEYLNYLFKDKISVKTEPFDTSKTINNYYSNNDSLDEQQYHIKLILRTIIYIPSEYLKNNIEDKAIYKFKKQKTNKWLIKSEKSLKKIDEMEKDSELSNLEKNLQKKMSKKNIFQNLESLKIYTSKNNSNESKSEEENESNSYNMKENNSNLSEKLNSIEIRNKNNELNETENYISINDKISNKGDINEEKEEDGNIREDYKDFSDNDIEFDFSLHEEQMPDDIKE